MGYYGTYFAEIQQQFEENDKEDCELWAEFTRTYVSATQGPFDIHYTPHRRTKEEIEYQSSRIFGGD